VADTIYRVVLEALTNVRRHAPSAARIDVHIARRDTTRGPGVTVSVRDDAPTGSAARTATGTGSGLIALRERVECIGGTLHAGQAADGGPRGWIVSATIPLPGEESAS
jgi:signal transduction histidine kinase